MIANDIIIFVNEDGATRSFKRAENGLWDSEQFNGFPSDADIQAVIDSGRIFILLRGGFIVETNLTQVIRTV